MALAGDATHLFDPQIGGHHLILKVYLDELRQLEAQPNCEGLSVVNHRPYQTIVVAQQIIVESFRVRIGFKTYWRYKGQD